ncbi:MAG: zinc ABC transporter substrate-binding protein [Candidatus Pacebacteria bacterium]|nr:zinc ABC transporter substrate-binding protein [Candidatus Paceibacterota bacterium]
MTKTYVWIGIVILLIAGIFILSGHKQSESPTGPEKLQVTASFYPMYFFASEIGKDKADVTNITPAGGEPHDYEPTAQDIATIEQSRLLILNGGGLEVWGGKITENIDPKQTLLVTAGENLTNQKVMEEGKNITDPHVWLSPKLAEQMVDKIEAGFEQVDPTNAPYYKTNAETFKTKLNNLDMEYASGLSMCKKKDIITSHAAFGYVATAYHLNQIPIAGLSPDAEPSPSDLAKVATYAKVNNVKYIFFESLVSPKLSETIAREVGAKTLVLNPIEGLTPDEISSGKSYLTEMQNNLTNLKLALECQ